MATSTTIQKLADLRAEEADRITAGVDAAYAADDYVTDPDPETGDGGGDRDNEAVKDAAYLVVAKAQVGSLGERKPNAVTRGTLVEEVFPSLVTDNFGEEDDPVLSEAVYAEIRRVVGTFLSTEPSGPVQQRVGLMTPGWALCKTKVGADEVTAYYVTNDLACFKEDLAGPLGASLRRAHKKYARNMAMLTGRDPDNAGTYSRLLKDASKNGLKAGEVEMAPALEAAKKDDGGDE